MKKYVIGVDFGTLSARALLVCASDGKEIAASVFEYPHKVMDKALPSGAALGEHFALQHPTDYLEALEKTVKAVISDSGVSPEDILGIGIDFTACTLLPINKDGTPLCMLPEFENEPHAYVKLWKHHAAWRQAELAERVARERDESWLSIYGGKLSSEWALPKILETLRCAPEVYSAAFRFCEAADWLSLILTGEETHSAPFAGYKGLWNADSSYPSDEYMRALDERLGGIVGTKLSEKVLGMDKLAGVLNERGAALTGLNSGTYVSLPMIDAHAAMPALKAIKSGELMMILGTSTCHIINAKEAKSVPGICGYVKDGVVPGLVTYEAGQAAVGDIFDWYVKNCAPKSIYDEAEKRGIGVHALLTEKASKRAPGESGLIALDWLNGNRSVLVNPNLSGMLLGLTLTTAPEDIYRALIEATAYGTRMIIETFVSSGIEITSIVASGGISLKNDMMMQIYADVCGREIKIGASAQAGALGSAIYASVAAGIYPSLEEACAKMSKPSGKVFRPNPESKAVYDVLYAEYKALHDYFGKGGNNVMKKLLEMK